MSFKNGPSLQEESAQTFVAEETDTCIADGSVRLVDPSFAKVVNPSHVTPKANGKLRWIADCRHTNGQCASAQFSLSSPTLHSTKRRRSPCIRPSESLLLGRRPPRLVDTTRACVRLCSPFRRRSEPVLLPQDHTMHRGVQGQGTILSRRLPVAS